MTKILFYPLLVILVLISLQCALSGDQLIHIFPDDVMKHAGRFNVKEIKRYDKSTLKQHYFFDEKGNLREKIYYTDSMEISGREQYEVDEENNLIESRSSDTLLAFQEPRSADIESNLLRTKKTKYREEKYKLMIPEIFYKNRLISSGLMNKLHQ